MDFSSLLVVSLGLAAAEPIDLCSTHRPHPALVRSADETLAVGEVLEERMEDHDWGWGREALLRDGPPRVGQPEASVVRIDEVDGPGTDLVKPGDEVAVVLWSLGEGCEWVNWRDVLDRGSRHHFRMSLRPDSLWIEDRPTFDVGPDQLAFPGTTDRYQGVPLEVYLDFVRRTPTVEDWQRDCRPFVLSLEEWAEKHPRYMRGPPFGVDQLRTPCNAVLSRHAGELERSPFDAEPAARLSGWAEQNGCRIQATSGTERYTVVEGRFTGGGEPQWAILCVSDDGWRLLVLELGDTIRATELVSMAGGAAGWLIRAAPPQYFEWKTATEFRRRSPSIDRPEKDVVLLFFRSEAPQAFFVAEEEGHERWVRVQAGCCRWPDDFPGR